MIFLPDNSRVIEIEDGVWEIVDSDGYSVYTSHCCMPHCGQQTFKKKRIKNFVCNNCYKKIGAMRSKIDSQKRRFL